MTQKTTSQIGQMPSNGPLCVVVSTQRSWASVHTAQSAKAWKLLLAVLCLYLLPAVSLAQDQLLSGPVMRVVSRSGGSLELPLVEERLQVLIDQGHASTEFHHSFQNESKENLEGRYQISLGTVATADGFAYWNHEQKVVGEIFEKEAARRVYETVTGQGADPGLLERSGEGTFAFRVAPIAPGEKKRVFVSTSTWLRQVGSTLEYRAPLGLSGQGSVIRLRDSRKITKIWSPTHELQISKKGTDSLVKLGKRSSQKTAGLVLRYTVEEADFALSTAFHRSKDQDAYLVVSLATPESYKQKREARDVTLVIDRSGSMTGAPLAAARRATVGVLKRLYPEDRVNIVTFDDGADTLYSTPQKISLVRKEAIAHVEGITSGGGTDLALALQEALSHQMDSDRPRFVLFLTDGQSDPAQALQAASGQKSTVRLYTVGIGAGVDRALLSRLARENGGRFTYVADESKLERDVNLLYSSITTPSLADIRVELDGATMRRMYPRLTPDLFDKDQLTFALRIRPNQGRKTAKLLVRAKGKTGSRLLSKTIPLSPAHKPWVGRMWATQRVDDLLEQISLEGEKPELKTETIELALAYDLVTRYTSFLAIPESEISSEVRGSIEEERKRRQRILAKHKDAAALSRTLMPPGDPLLSVRAPHDAQGVSAVFPFGLTLDLKYSPKSEMWEGRFLVPNTVVDGSYKIHIFVVERSGELSKTSTDYEIDSQAPAFEVATTVEEGGLRIVIDADEALREVRVEAVTSVALDEKFSSKLYDSKGLCDKGGCLLKRVEDSRFTGRLQLQPGSHQLRIVVSDRARNETVRLITIEIPAKGDDS